MALEAETKDCTALTDTEISEMAELVTGENVHFNAEHLTTQRDAWVLVTLVRDGAKLAAYGFCTLERVGGDPTVLIGAGATRRSARRDSALRALVTDQLRRAVLAFPDEDVLIACQMADAAAFTAFKSLDRVVPRPGYEPNGEDRAWGRRLAKRFDVRGDYKAREFKVYGNGGPSFVLNHTAAQPQKLDPALVDLFDEFDTANGDALIAFGWASRENLAKLL